jgi:hypothetical protein
VALGLRLRWHGGILRDVGGVWLRTKTLLIAEVAKKGRGGRGEKPELRRIFARAVQLSKTSAHISKKEVRSGTPQSWRHGDVDAAGIFRLRLCFAIAKRNLRSR